MGIHTAPSSISCVANLLCDEWRKLSGRVEGAVTGATPVVALGKRLVVVQMQGQGLYPLQPANVVSPLIIYLLTSHIWVLLMLYLQPVIRRRGISCSVLNSRKGSGQVES